MIIRKKRIKINADQMFTYDQFVEKILKIGTNLKYSNDLIKIKLRYLYDKLINDEGELYLCDLIKWFKLNVNFNTNKSSKIEYWLERGWIESEANIVMNKRKCSIQQRNPLCVEYWINKGYSEEESKEIISKKQTKYSSQVKNRGTRTKESLRKLGYSEKELDDMFLSPSNIKFWIRNGYNEEQAKEKISEIQRKNSLKFSTKRKENPNIYSAISTTQIAYWLNKGYSEEESKKLVSERQSTFSLEKCILKYGEEKGLERFLERQSKWQKELYKNNKLKAGYSNISQELFNILLKKYDINDMNFIMFALKNGEFVLCENNAFYRYDFVDIKNKKIIEYHGDLYHGNPEQYISTDCPNPYKPNTTAKEMWEKDERKKLLAEKHGYEVFVIWDSEYRLDKDSVIKKCINFLNIKND